MFDVLKHIFSKLKSQEKEVRKKYSEFVSSLSEILKVEKITTATLEYMQ